MNVRVYVEGGGDGKKLKTECRKAFSSFFRKAGLVGRMPRIVACGRRNSAYKDFCTALRTPGDNDFPILLVDSESASPLPPSPWQHLRTRDGWKRPDGAKDEQAHLMVQVMESWFLADSECLVAYFGRGFAGQRLPGDTDIEQTPKQRVLESLHAATRECRSKGAYSKGKHSFAILATIDPAKVRKASKHAESLLSTLSEKCG